MRYFFLILFLLNSVLLFSNNTEEVILVKDTLTNTHLNKYTYVYITEDTSSNIYNIINKKFKYYPKGVNEGVTNKIYWIKYKFKNPVKQNKTLYIYFPYSHINKIKAYSKYNNHIEHLINRGIFYDITNKDLDVIGHPIRINLKQGITEVYIYINHINLPLRGVSFLLTKQEIIQSNIKSTHLIWFWKGFFAFSMLLTIILYFATRLKMFLYYFLLNVGVGLFFASEIGDISQLLISDTYNFTIDIKHFGNLIILFFFPLLINQITPVSRSSPKLWKIMFYAIYPIIIFWIICLIPAVKYTRILYITTYYFIILSGIIFLLQLVFTFRGFIKKQRNSLALFIAYGFYISAIFLNVILPNLGFIENDLQVYDSFIFGSLFEIIMFMGLIGKETISIYRQRSVLLKKQKNHQTEIIKAIVESQEKERNRVGRELHDMIGANISVIKQQVDKTNSSLISIINRTIDEVRSLSHGLVTPLIKDDEFVDEINDLCNMFSNLEIKIKSNFHNWTKIKNTEKATHLYRIIQELLQNAVKHSKAENVLIQFIINKKSELTVMYEDDGIGFNYKSCYCNKGLGLINIANRIKLIGGSILYDTQEGRKGTTIIINVTDL